MRQLRRNLTRECPPRVRVSGKELYPVRQRGSVRTDWYGQILTSWSRAHYPGARRPYRHYELVRRVGSIINITHLFDSGNGQLGMTQRSKLSSISTLSAHRLIMRDNDQRS